MDSCCWPGSATGSLLLCLCRCLFCLYLLVDLGGGSIYCFSQGLHGLLDLIEIVLSDRFPDCCNAFFYLGLVCSIEFVTALLEHLFCGKDCGVSLVAEFDLLALLLVVRFELLCGIHHLLDVFFGEFLVALDGDGLLVAGTRGLLPRHG